MTRQRLLSSGLTVLALLAGPRAAPVLAATIEVEQVADIFPGGDGISDSFGTDFGLLDGVAYFKGEDGVHGSELWRTDGTAAGTTLVADINPGAPGSGPNDFTPVGEVLVFSAQDGTRGRELWRTDGTAAGTTLVADLGPGPSSGAGAELAAFGDVVLFSGDDGTGRELWRTDGTEDGTWRVKDINTQPDSDFSGASISGLTVVGDVAYFSADDGLVGRELWRTDGTEDGTALVADIRPGENGSSPFTFTPVADAVVFTANDGATGSELWRTDGTTAGTELVADLLPGPEGSLPFGFADLGESLLFVATHAQAGRELWRTDGTTEGTALVADINPDGDARRLFSGPLDAAVLDGVAYLRLNEPVAGEELWRSDGTAAGTSLVRDIVPGTDGSFSGLPTALGRELLFEADRQLWRTDGTEAGTRLLAEIDPRISLGFPALVADLAGTGQTMLFAADDGITGLELWRASVLTPPGPPTGVTAAGGDAQATVAWVAPADDGGSPVTGFVVSAEPGGATAATGPDVAEATVAGLTNGTSYTFTVTARNAVGSGPPSAASSPVTPTPPPEPPGPTEPPEPSPTPEPPEPTGEPQPPEVRRVLRWSGSGRAETAARVSAEAYADGAAVAYVATGLGFADALAGGPAAALAGGGPILLVTRDAVPEATRAELTRLDPDRVVVLGGTGVVSDQVADLLAQAADAPVSRLSGPDRFATAAAVSQASFDPDVDAVFIATGLAFPDALAGGAAAAALGGPVLLVTPDTIPEATAAELSRLQPEAVDVLGGSAAVNPDVAAQVEALAEAPVTRLSGPDRFATAAAVAQGIFADADAAFVATGLAFPDALAGVPAAAINTAPLLLVATDALPAPTLAQLDRLDPGLVVILGGTAAISAQVEQALAR